MRRHVNGSLLVALAMLMASLGAATSATASSTVEAHHVNPPKEGSYRFHYYGGTGSTAQINSDLTWNQNYMFGSDVGTWVWHGGYIALTSTSDGNGGEGGFQGCVLLGKRTPNGFDSKNHPGSYLCPGNGPSGVFSWYACIQKDEGGCYFPRNSNTDPSYRILPGIPITTSYTLFWRGQVGTLTIDRGANTWSAAFTSPVAYTDSGTWLTRGTAFAMVGGSASDSDCLFLGTIETTKDGTNTGINTVKRQGPSNCDGSLASWYATAG
jgi:hypothetical protein